MPSDLVRRVACSESLGMRHYSRADASRLGRQRVDLVRARRQTRGGAGAGGAGFHAAAALRSHPLYTTETTATYPDRPPPHMLLSASLSDRPGWRGTGGPPKRSTLSNKFTDSFAGNCYEDSSIGSVMGRDARRRRDEEKKIQAHADRAKLYAELVARQEEETRKRAERRRRRAERYRTAVSAATMIENRARMFLARRRVARVVLGKQNAAATRIQMQMRRRSVELRAQQRYVFKVQTAATRKIQYGWQQRLARVEAKDDLQRRRDNRARARRRLLREMDKERRALAAVMIQNMVRGWKGRKIVKLLEMERRRARRRRKNTTKKKNRASTPGKSSRKTKKKGKLND